MECITHERFRGIAMCGERLNIPHGTPLELRHNVITTREGKAICFDTSENGKKHFARNDDGRGLERGHLTHAIAYSDRIRTGAGGRRQRFSDEEIAMLCRDYQKWLRPNLDVILFNDAFFAAEVDELEELAKKLGIKAKRR